MKEIGRYLERSLGFLLFYQVCFNCVLILENKNDENCGSKSDHFEFITIIMIIIVILISGEKIKYQDGKNEV